MRSHSKEVVKTRFKSGQFGSDMDGLRYYQQAQDPWWSSEAAGWQEKMPQVAGAKATLLKMWVTNAHFFLCAQDSQEKLPISLYFSSQINSSFLVKTQFPLVCTEILPILFSPTQDKDSSFLNSGLRRENWETPLAGDSEIWKHAIELWQVGFGVLCFSCLKSLTFSFLNLAKKQGSWKNRHFSMLKKKCFLKNKCPKIFTNWRTDVFCISAGQGLYIQYRRASCQLSKVGGQ